MVRCAYPYEELFAIQSGHRLCQTVSIAHSVGARIRDWLRSGEKWVKGEEHWGNGSENQSDGLWWIKRVSDVGRREEIGRGSSIVFDKAVVVVVDVMGSPSYIKDDKDVWKDLDFYMAWPDRKPCLCKTVRHTTWLSPLPPLGRFAYLYFNKKRMDNEESYLLLNLSPSSSASPVPPRS